MTIDVHSFYTPASFERLKKLADTKETPFVVIDTKTIEEHYIDLKKGFPIADIFYAMKANANIAVVKQFISMGAGVEVASAGELYVCKKLGVNPKDIVP